MKNKWYAIELVTGDWSNDGHGKEYIENFKVNKTQLELDLLYKTSVEKTGLRLCEEVCNNYSDNKISQEILKLFEDHKEPLVDILEVDYGVCKYEWPIIYLRFCRMSDPDLKWKPLTKTSTKINIGGYGLFD